MTLIINGQITLNQVFDGVNGVDGIDGVNGSDGASYYTWVKYADTASGAGMSDLPDNKDYIGFAYNKTSPNESTNPSEYTWSLFKGEQGIQGSAGVDGQNGETFYTWLKYADTPTSGMSDSPTGKLYMGIAYNKKSSTESTNYNDYSWSLIKGDKGDKGDTGLIGPAGANGKPTYTWLKYADSSSGAGMSDNPTGKKYIGLAYNKDTINESTNASDYTWSLIQGEKGETGDAGVKGADGITYYTWVKYSNSSTGANMSDSPDGMAFIGIAYNKTSKTESTNPSEYAWSLIKGDKGDTGATGPIGPAGPKGQQGIQGVQGSAGASLYTWVKYATSSAGAGMSDSPTGKSYIGFAYNKTSATESTNASDYVWSKIEGEQGVAGTNGIDGKTTYTWIKYADDASGNGMSDSPTNKRFLGLAHNKNTATESTNKADYTWSPLYDNVEVGSKNLATFTDFKKYGSPMWKTYNSNASITFRNGYAELLGKVLGLAGVSHNAGYYNQVDSVDANVKYVLSFTAKVSTGTLPLDYCYVMSSGGNYSLSGYPTVSTTEKRYSIFFTPSSARRDFGVMVGCKNLPVGTTLFVKDIKLEKGNVATDYTASPLDIDNEINNVEEKINNAVVTVDKTGINILDGNFSLESTNGGKWWSYDARTLQSTQEFKNHVLTLQNELADHSFELLETKGNVGSDGLFNVPTVADRFGRWGTVATPKLLSEYDTDIGISSIPFGSQAVIVDRNNYVRQMVRVEANAWYTFSFHVSTPFNKPAGEGEIYFRLVGDNDVEVQAPVYSYTPVPVTNFNESIRYAVSFKTPNIISNHSTRLVEIGFRSKTAGQWVSYDGIQFVAGKVPVTYVPDTEAWRTRRGGVDKYPAIMSGDIEVNKVKANKLSNGGNMVSVRDGFSYHENPFLFQNRLVTVAVSSASNFVDITFPEPFDSAPLWVVAQPTNSNSTVYNSAIYNITATGCRLYLTHIHNTAFTGNIQAQIVALGTRVQRSTYATLEIEDNEVLVATPVETDEYGMIIEAPAE